MSTCNYERQLSAYHDGELPPAAAAELESHLDGCPACQAELRRLRNMSSLLGEAVAAAYVPDGAMRRWQRSVRPARDRAILRTTQMFAAAAAALLLFCATALWQTWPVRAGRPDRSAGWESAAVRTASPKIRSVAGQLTDSPQATPDVQLANTILAGPDNDGRADQP